MDKKETQKQLFLTYLKSIEEEPMAEELALRGVNLISNIAQNMKKQRIVDVVENRRKILSHRRSEVPFPREPTQDREQKSGD